MDKAEGKDAGVLLDFYSEGCAPCKRMEPVIKNFESQDYGVAIRRIEASDAPDAFENYGIRSVPTFVYLKDGKEKGRITGVCALRDIERLITEG